MTISGMARLSVMTFAAFVALVLGPVPSASAHTWTDFYGTGSARFGMWANGQNITYYIRSSGFPSSSYISRVQDGAAEWTAVGSGAPEPDFIYGGTTLTVGDFDSPCNSGYSGVYWRDLNYLSTNYVGYTKHCKLSSGMLSKFQISIDSTGTAWYAGTGTPGASDNDLQSIATHEFGHATGFTNHFAQGGVACQVQVTDDTMCPTHTLGTTRWRTLSDHDLHTFQGAY